MSGTSTEDSILGTIPDFKDDVDDTATSGTEATQQTSGGSEGDATTSAQPTGTGSEGSGTEQPKQQQAFRRRHDGLIEQPNADNPRVRDLVDPVTGRTVAKGGVERHVYEEGQRHFRENSTLKQQVQQLQGFVQSVNQVTQEAARLNVKPEDQMVAMRVMSDFMRDPVKTLEYLVAEVKAKGYPIPFLEQGVSPGMDMTAIARMIDTKMQPFTQQHQQTIEQQQTRQRAERELNSFLEDNQEAQSNLDVLGEMLQAQPSLSLSSAYTKMIRWSHENGLDWTQPLKPQIAALQQQSQQPTHQQPTQQDTTRPMPGRGAVRGNATPLNGSQGQQFNESASWSDIIGSAMRESGVRIN
jgi:hypothetical protein